MARWHWKVVTENNTVTAVIKSIRCNGSCSKKALEIPDYIKLALEKAIKTVG